jgi:hypothetical protein
MKRILLVLLFIFLLTGCNDAEEEVNTLTCEYDGKTTVYEYTDEELVGVFMDGEESKDVKFWSDLIDESYDGSISAFLEDMEEWYTSPVFEKSSCVYE